MKQTKSERVQVIGLYLNPPRRRPSRRSIEGHSTAVVARASRAARLRIFRHGTLSLYAAFDTQTGEVLGKTAERHTSAEFIAFLTDIVANQPEGKEIHVIADNLSTHKTKRVDEFLPEHPNVHMHFTPTYSSWLNQVELWFPRSTRGIARGVFTSVSHLKESSCATSANTTSGPSP